MFLVCFALVALRIWWSLDFSLTELLNYLYPFHQFCLSRVSQNHLPSFYGGLICGEPLPRTDLTVQLFLETGLYHLLIVSGSHLIFIANILSRLNLKYRSWHWVGLCSYAGMCLLSPPIARSLLQLIFSAMNQKKHLFWTQEQLVFSSGIACLLLFPDWFFSFSFVLSWTASLTLCFTRKLLAQHCLIFCFMWPLLKNISPWSIVYNFLVSPLFSAVLFPASVLTFIIPVLNRMTEPLWQLFFDLLKLGPTLRTSQTLEIPSVTALWIYVIAIHALLRLLPLWNESADRRLRELSSAL